MITAVERFKKRFADAVERICVLEEQLEKALGELEALRAERTDGSEEK